MQDAELKRRAEAEATERQVDALQMLGEERGLAPPPATRLIGAAAVKVAAAMLKLRLRCWPTKSPEPAHEVTAEKILVSASQ